MQGFLNKKNSIIINYLKCLLCIGVVFLHCIFTPNKSPLLWGEWHNIDYTYFNAFILLFSKLFLNNTCVPMFFVISGYLFFLDMPEQVDKYFFFKKWKKRLSSLLVPYLIANTAYLILAIVRKEVVPSFETLKYFWIYKENAPIDLPLWFMRDLMVVCLFTPILYLLIHKFNVALPLIFLACWLEGWYPSHLAGLGIKSFTFFSIGSWFAIKKIDFVTFFKTERFGMLYLFIYLILLSVVYLTNNDTMLKVSTLCCIPVWVTIASFLAGIVKKECPKTLIAGTFFVFMYHDYYLAGASTRLVLALTGTSEAMCFVAYISGVMITCSILLFIYALMKRFIPSVASIVVGGR